MKMEITLKHDEDGWIIAECPELPGCVSQGRTEAEAFANIREAAVAWRLAESLKAIGSGAKPLV